MGKVLIVKGVDFSPNAIDVVYPDWYIGYNNSVLIGTNSMASGYFYIRPEEMTRLNLLGKEIKYIKCYASAEGVINVGVVNNASSPAESERGATYSYSVSQGINIIELKEGITLSSTTSMCVSGTVLTYNGSTTSEGWLFYRVGSNAVFTSKIPIDLGGDAI